MDEQNPRILAIDDHADNLTALRAILADTFPGSAVFTAASGPEGLRQARDHEPDIILLDLVMPGMDGFEVCHHLKRDDRLRDIPVIMLTAVKTSRDHRIQAMEAGAEAFLSKPVDEVELIAQIRAMVKIRAANLRQREETGQLAALVSLRTTELEKELESRRKTELELQQTNVKLTQHQRSMQILLEDLQEEIETRKATEQQLRESEEKFRSITEQTTDMIYVTDSRGYITYISPASLPLFGFTPEEMQGRPFTDFLDESSAATAMAAFQQAISTGITSKHLELAMKHRDGSVFTGELNGTLYRKEDSGGTIGLIRDISARKKIEETLLFMLKCGTGGEDFFVSLARFLAHHLHMDYVCIDRLIPDGLTARTLAVFHDGRFEDNVTYSLHDTPCGQVAGQTICCFPRSVRQLFPRDEALQQLEAESYAGVTLWDSRGQPAGLIAVIGRSPLIDTQGVESILKLVASRAGGELERRQAGEALRLSEEKFSKIFQSSPDGILITRLRDGLLVDVNAGFCQLTGYSREEALGRQTVELGLWADPQDRLQVIGRLREQGQLHGQEYSFCHKSGRPFHGLISAVIIHLEDEAHILTIVRDISGLKQAERHRLELERQLQHSQRLESLGVLAGGVAHDFNNILGAILGYAEMTRDDLARESPGHSALENLGQVILAGRRAATLVQQILTFSRQTRQQARPLDVALITKEAMTLLRASIPSTIQIRTEISPGSGKALADPVQIHQVIMNLCTNAFHAMRDTGGTLTVRLDRTEAILNGGEKQPCLRLTVTDTGCGIDPAMQEKIFDPFFTTKRQGEGTGLGLSMVHGIVAAAGGRIQVESEPGRGSTFTIFLPRMEETESQAEPSPEEESGIRGSGRLLLVDDEPSLAAMLGQRLHRAGYEVEIFTNSLAAFQSFMEAPRRFHLVITDQTMPNLTGLELAAAIHRQAPGLPVILLTGYSDQITTGRLEQAGVHRVLHKPVQLPLLLDALRQDLRGGPPEAP